MIILFIIGFCLVDRVLPFDGVQFDNGEDDDLVFKKATTPSRSEL